MSTASTAATLAERIAWCIARLDHRGLAGLYRPDAVLDANVPQWRYQLRGPAAILEQIIDEQAGRANARVAWSRATPMEGGVVVETEVRFEEAGEQRLWRDVHVVRTDGSAIAEHVVFCTGTWDAATIARQAVEAPMVARRPGAAGDG
ncbi:MAG TPA: hypothetical protein VM390_03050 [Acidimicrobiales bacterium]|nr:hypothetical protein [Acidimicrobiales bacterium]